MISSSSSFLLLKTSRLRTLSGKISPATRTHSRQLERTTTQKRTKEEKKQPLCCCRRRIVFVAASSSSHSSSIKKVLRASPLLSLSRSLCFARSYEEYCVCVLLLYSCDKNKYVTTLTPLSSKSPSFFCSFFSCLFFFCSRKKKEKEQKEEL